MDIFKHYNHQIFETYQNPDAREESFYGILSNFIYQVRSEILNLKPEICITTLPKKTDAGSPDFKITQGLNTIGYIEAKKPLEDLDKTEDSPQLKRYRETYYFFVPKADGKLQKEYSEFLSVTEIFKNWISGAETRQDAVMVQFKKKQIELVIKNLISDKTDQELTEMYSFTENANWKLNEVRRYLKSNYNPDNIIQYCYRPFDTRWVYFDKKAFGRPRKPLMDNMLHENLGLMLMREYFYDRPISNFFVVNKVADSRIGLSNRGSAYLFPLYLYQKTSSPRKRFQFTEYVAEPPAEYLMRVPNLTYIYAVLYSKNYRERYRDFLKTDFPKIPFADFGEFKRLSELGFELVALHTMKHPSINDTTVKFPIAGENIVKHARYDPDNKRVFINDEQYFEGIKESLWNYLIGGYQVLDRWLKYRIGRSLDNEDIIYFIKIAKAIEETIKIEEAL